MKKADTIASALKAKGYNVVWNEQTEDRIAVGVAFIGSRELPWVRAFHLDADACDPPAFIREIEDWKKDIRKHLTFGVASPTVRAVIAHYGLPRTERAIAPNDNLR